ncbi:mechanosensitive ion channel family protein [Kineosporia rhizophila]|uniref:mechanosensitive ion channel family protein n=1 Tax=Kineosporia rhizophila TaxID=84633 RepID=UPI001E5A75B0|nr:mechanosensitive ion channel family protein [Kineosporia rhizophila]
MDLDLWTSLLLAVAIAIAAGLVAWTIAGLAVRLANRADAGSVLTINRLCRRPVILTVAMIALQVAVQALPSVPGPFTRAAGIAVILSACWLIVRALLAGEEILFWRLRMDVADNRRVRRARTQITLVRRVLGVVVIVLGLAAVLMSFPQLRTFGASLLASAGVAGIIAGLAAQTTLGNMFAGLQLAFTDAVRIDDVVVVEGEWGWIEEITLTYVVVHLWDERRLVLPTSYFVTTPFQNWTRNQARILGSVMLYLDYATPLTELREHARQVIDANPLWDRQAWVLQVVDTTETTMLVRVLASANDGPSAWDLRCDIRESLLTWLQTHHPQSLPVQRNIGVPGELGFRDGVVSAEEAGLDDSDGFGSGSARNGSRRPAARPPRARNHAPVTPDPETAHLDLQMPNHAEEYDDEDAAPLDPRGRPSGDGGGGASASAGAALGQR